jgi:hypothetical protein
MACKSHLKNKVTVFSANLLISATMNAQRFAFKLNTGAPFPAPAGENRFLEAASAP